MINMVCIALEEISNRLEIIRIHRGVKRNEIRTRIATVPDGTHKSFVATSYFLSERLPNGHLIF